MLGDLPIPIDESGRVIESIEWADFAAFMKRLEHHVGGPEALESCGEHIGDLKPARMLTSLAGFSASPYSLYRAASLWALRRAMPGIETSIEEKEPNRIVIHARIMDGLRPCPQILHLATGGARALPRVLGLGDAVVTASVEDFEARYEIIVPPSRTLWARTKRIARTIFSASSVLQFLEAQQLELQAKNQALQLAHEALAESESRFRAMTDTAVDVLCELNENGQIEYVSASIKDLLGYTPEQVTGSHFSLWVPPPFRDIAKKRLALFASQPIEQPINHQRIRLHTESGDFVVAELSLRSYRTPEGELRMVGILRDQSEGRSHESKTPTETSSEKDAVLATPRMTEIVENVMVQAPYENARFGWLETEKLIDLIEFEFQARIDHSDITLRLDVSDAPATIWGDERLFAASLGSLFDWAVALSQGSAPVSLRIDSNDDRAVVFSVRTTAKTGSEAQTSVGNRAAARERLAAAAKAVIPLGGSLIPTSQSDACYTNGVQVPQPRHAG